MSIIIENFNVAIYLLINKNKQNKYMHYRQTNKMDSTFNMFYRANKVKFAFRSDSSKTMLLFLQSMLRGIGVTG